MNSENTKKKCIKLTNRISYFTTFNPVKTKPLEDTNFEFGIYRRNNYHPNCLYFFIFNF